MHQNIENNYYPKWVYHKVQNAKIVQSKEEHLSLEKGWAETPFENKKDKKICDESCEAKKDSDHSVLTEEAIEGLLAEVTTEEPVIKKKTKSTK